jgi:hypothetical protein
MKALNFVVRHTRYFGFLFNLGQELNVSKNLDDMDFRGFLIEFGIRKRFTKLILIAVGI